MLIKIPFGKEIGEQSKRVFYSKSLNVSTMHLKKIFFLIYDIFFLSISSLKKKGSVYFPLNCKKKSKESFFILFKRLSFMMKIKASQFQPLSSHERRLPKSSQFLPQCSHIVRNSIWLKKNRDSDNEGKFHSFLMCRIWIYSQKLIS